MIPKRLITTWIHDHRDPYTETHRQLFARCLASWKRLMPSWEIRIVSAENLFDVGENAWCRARLEEGNFIGASTWARYAWLQKLGGIYVDMDVEAIQPFDPLLRERFVVGRQKDKFLNTAIIGSEADHALLKTLLVGMQRCDPANPQFGNECGPRLLTRLLRGIPRRDVTIKPPAVFYPYHWDEPFAQECITKDTIAVHHWASTWWPPKELGAA